MKNIIKKIDKLFETIKIKLRRQYILKTAKHRSKKISNKDFSIISNNCWGGFVYQSYNMEYKTPTIGMFFMAEDYIKFISNLNHYLLIDNFINVKPNESKWYELLKDKDNFGKYPIAKLDDIELHLLHYKSIEEAEKKWNKRKKRINYSNIIYKFSEMNNFKEKDLKDFQDLNLENKICFVSNKYLEYTNSYTFVVSKRKDGVKATQEPIGKNIIIDINNIINELK